jgi:hypothetical protein
MVVAFLIVAFAAECAVRALFYVLALAVRAVIGGIQVWRNGPHIPQEYGALG